ncbi:hypothetical protein [Dokdonella sp.]|uniref:hypothetical protein n=1 Tax=Dokdonella sp. TaxID=2291710 RepID=UPI0037851872
MDAFSYLSVLLSIIVGLAITQVLKGFRGLMLARGRTRSYWPAVTWAVLVLVIAVQTWWSMFGLREHSDWTFFAFSIVVTQTIAIYLLAALVLPDFAPGEVVDLRAHFIGNHRWFSSMLLLLIGISLVKSVVVGGNLPEWRDLAYHGVFIALGVTGVATTRPRVHEALAVIAAFVIGSYIVLLFTYLT